MFIKAFIFLLGPFLLGTLVYAFEECCTAHDNMKLLGRAATGGSDSDWEEFDTQSKDLCKERCLDNSKCVASMFKSSDNKCTEFYQTPKQEYNDENTYTAFLCRTRAMQVCIKHDQWRGHDNGSVSGTTFEEFGSINSADNCLATCKGIPHRQIHGATYYRDANHCYCYFVIPAISYSSDLMDTYVCTQRTVSCKAVACETTCMSAGTGCGAATYDKDNRKCHVFPGGSTPGQFPEPDENYVSFLCSAV